MQSHGKAEARDERERMRRIDRQRRQQREDVVQEMILDPCPVGLWYVAAIDQDDSDFAQDAAQVAPDRLLIGGEFRDRLVDENELLRRGQAIRAALGDALAHLRLDAGHADHEELIKVIGRNRQETHPLQRRVARIDGFLKHPAIEVQPGQFAVDETFWTCSDRGTRMSFHVFFFENNSLCGIHRSNRSIQVKAAPPADDAAQSMCYRDDVSMTLMFLAASPSSRIGCQPGPPDWAPHTGRAASARVTALPSRNASVSSSSTAWRAAANDRSI